MVARKVAVFFLARRYLCIKKPFKPYMFIEVDCYIRLRSHKPERLGWRYRSLEETLNGSESYKRGRGPNNRQTTKKLKHFWRGSPAHTNLASWVMKDVFVIFDKGLMDVLGIIEDNSMASFKSPERGLENLQITPMPEFSAGNEKDIDPLHCSRVIMIANNVSSR
ncbi:hypothetical protein PIB30_047079 [Stylosanthes scabra]|uniref:Uncharacterized protein n=1 Tax=Stylosanthes scabra TaxID=79078 RepID=A0ABU6WGZ7_9FABA|nr:hypothetical protein [Stylosanthes scabra]